MSIPLRVLIVENSEDDARSLVRALRRDGYGPTFERVETAAAMKAALEQQTWDLVISDYSMPHFSGLDALTLLKESGLDLPFIIVSNAIGEETTVEAMRAGAHDYIMKGNLAQLIPAIERELQDAEVRRERRRAEEALKELVKQIERAKQEWESTADSLPELICLVDDRGRIIRANRVVETWNLGRVADVKGREFHELLHPSCAGSSCYLNSFWKQAWEEAIRGQPAQCEAYDEVLKRHVLVQVQPWKDWGKRTAIGSTVVVVRDITERVAVERMRDNLTDMIVHDLRNPLSNVVSSLGLMRDAIVGGDETLPMPQLLAVATRGCERLFRLVDTVLDLRRLGVAEVELTKVPVNPRELAEEVAEQMQPSALSRKQSLEVQVAPGVPDVPADRELLLRVLDNLLDNAIKFTPREGHIVLRVEQAGDSSVLFAVSDDGPGIPPEHRDRIFDRFFRLESAANSKGSGLGLAFCKLAVEAHGGCIRVESRLGQPCGISPSHRASPRGISIPQGQPCGIVPIPQGQGATFSFTLPLEASKSISDNSGGKSNES